MNPALTHYGDIFVGRQPILGPSLKTVGYEVLYRNCEIDYASFENEEIATATVLLNTYLDIGLEHVVGSHLAFLNIPKPFLIQNYCEALPKDRVVLEVLENVQPTPDVLQALQGLSQKGYTIALDDFEYEDRLKPFLEIADIVKVDVLGKSESQLERIARQLRNYPGRLLAEKVETRPVYQTCKELGFFYFQGFFFYRPDIIRGKEIPANRVALLELLGKIQDPQVTLKQLVEHIRNDLSLSYKILRYVNSAYVGLPQQVNSIDHAACLVGIDRIRTWSTLIIMASGKGQALEILIIALIRAKMCERIGAGLGHESTEKFFTLGLLSVLEALYESPMEDIVDRLPLPQDVLDALISETGELGLVLACVKAYEQGQWMELKSLRLDPAVIRDIYLEAIDWANSFSPMIN